MKTWKSCLALKITAIILFAASLVVFGLSALGSLIGFEFGLYSTQPPETYFQTERCYAKASNMAYQNILSPYLYYDEPLEVLENSYGGEYTNWAYTLVRKDGTAEEIISSTLNKNETYGFQETFVHTTEGGGTYLVTVAIKDPMPFKSDGLHMEYVVFRVLKHYATVFLVTAGISLLLCVLLYVMLCCMAGHRKGSDAITLNWMDRLPFDLYLVTAVVVIAILVSLSIDTGFYYVDLFANMLAGIGLLTACLIALAVTLSFATRVKAGKWWRNTVIYRLLSWIRRNGLRVARLTVRVMRAIPMVWRTLLVTCALLILLLFLGVSSAFGGGAALLLYFLLSLAIIGAVCFGAVQLQKLQKGGELLASGDFDAKIDLTHMYWDFKRHGEHLNSIGEGMSAAVEQRMKSERLKTELITNVSHDIKTPLTSIINYVDLLQKAHTPEEEAQYLEVLQRQAARLKKLTVDLVEASKASTGNIAANLAPTNVTESVNQALGEYLERLEAGSLTVVAEFPPEPVSVVADGRLLWRILDNLLNNVCKYALAGTRVYVLVEELEHTVRISVKNISRQQLNVSADELMERFVRGDSARSTEGSGLGLNIAKSLAELQKGQFQLAVDGDLFKAELILPKYVHPLPGPGAQGQTMPMDPQS